MTIAIRYEANELPQDSTPVWVKSPPTSIGIEESVSGGILSMGVPLGSMATLSYTRTEANFKRADLWIRCKRGSGSGAVGAFAAGFSDGTYTIIIGFDTVSDAVSFTVGNQNDIVLLDADTFHEFRIQMLTSGGGLPKAHLFVDGVLEKSLTSDVAFTPDRVYFSAYSDMSSVMREDVDYVRYRIMGTGSSHRRRSDSMLPDVRKPEVVKEKEKKEPRTLYIVFPADGSTESVSAGDLLLNFWDGEARLPDGSTKKLSGKLEGSGHEFMNSVYVDNPDQDIAISLDDMGWFTISANSFRGVILQPFRQCKIRTTATTSLKIFASTDGKSGLVAA